ncbi:hypothetical protein [Fibrivirga algicola]|uniref:Uncharacterized protein n=1 Tax=Fibrivirga algicola TaxID=2950420 RepID=A0ABX0QHU7_9BACT|nr:hypothetical protein [Fibrivirga algicola]NID10642.1 hypothetical protein [Fibrivirga algicola]
MKSIPLFLVCLLIFYLMSSCSPFKPSEKRIFRGNNFYRFNQQPAPAKNQLEVYTVEQPFTISSLTDKESYLSISNKIVQRNLSHLTKATVNIDSLNVNEYATYRTLNESTAFFIQPPDIIEPRKKFTYGDSKLVLQALAVPIKFRPRPNLKSLSNDPVKMQAAVDSFPQQVESGFNVGFSVGLKFSHNTFRNQKDALGRYTNQLSFSLAGLIGTGVTDISRTTARSLPASGFTARKNAFVSYGAVFLLGYNNINVGYAVGVDRALGQYNDNWVYQGQVWHGFIVALDVLK